VTMAAFEKNMCKVWVVSNQKSVLHKDLFKSGHSWVVGRNEL